MSALGRGLLAVFSVAAFSEAATKFSQLSRVADLCDEPRLRSGSRPQLLQDGLADRRSSEVDRVTSLCNRYIILPSVLAEEQSLFTFEQARQVQSAYRHINFKFHTLFFLSVSGFLVSTKTFLNLVPMAR